MRKDEAAGTTTSVSRRVVAGGALFLLLLMLSLWLGRRPLARHFADRELARRGVPARYTLADLGVGKQRLTDVVIGNPARPDLVADWIETDTTVGLSGARLRSVRAGRVRLRGRIVQGRLSLGSLDRLMSSSGGAASLPVLALHVADARMALATSAGMVLLRMRDGSGRLNDGFVGHVDAVASRLNVGDCRIEGARAAALVTTRAGRPTLTGRFAADRIPCGSGGPLVWRPGGDLQVTLGEHLDQWQGRLMRAGAAVVAVSPTIGAEKLSTTIAFAGNARRTTGTIQATTEAFAQRDVLTGRDGRFGGCFIAGRDGNRIDGEVRLSGMALDARFQRQVASTLPRLEGTPVAPLAAALRNAVGAAARRFDVALAGSWGAMGQRTGWRVDRARLSAASGARLVWAGSVGGNTSAHGRLSITGGGLPSAVASVTQGGQGTPLVGTATLSTWAAGGARLSLSPARFRWAPSAFDLSTRVTLTGPLGDGAVKELAMPVELRSRGDRLALNPGCTPLSWRGVASGGLVLDPGAVRLCATGAALTSIAGGRVSGGATLTATHLAGRLGSSALDLRLGGATLALGTRAVVAQDVAMRLGDPARPVRIEAARLEGVADGQGIAGRFDGAGGQIGPVPLLLSGGAGHWRFEQGRLALDGTLQVADTSSPARFQPLAARDIAFTLSNGAIQATGTLDEPVTGTKVATVTIAHDLSSGRGRAGLVVPGLDFTPGFQPDRLTRLIYGVIADVRGTVSGEAQIGWSPADVTSTGTFRTAGTDLAAAFGPVTGIATQIRFTDLLSLTSAPGQVATIAGINPGILVENGVVRYQTLPDARVRVEDARWPFAGGTLSLAPTLLDFGTDARRHMTFGVNGVAADRFLQQFDFKNLDATGVFDGTLPMIFDASGGRIEGGRLAVRPGGGSLAYLGEISRRNLGFWGNLAFGALRSLRYRDLSIAMNGPLAGEMVTDVRFSGVTQGKGATSNFLIRRLQRLPFVFNVRITAPFRGLIDSAQSFYDPKRLIDRNLPALLDAQHRAEDAPVQPPASEKVP